MQRDSIPPNAGRVAFRTGLIIGIILTFVETIILLISTFHDISVLESARGLSTVQNPVNIVITLVIGIVGFIVGLVAYFVAGILGSRATGKVSTGVFAGMWVGTFYGVIDCIIYIILLFTVRLGPVTNYYSRIYGSAAQVNQTLTAAIAISLVLSIIGVGVAVGLGAGMGALGGLLGRRSSKAPRPQQPYPGQPYQVQFYPGQPYPGQPYPGQPPYPRMQQYPVQGYPGQQGSVNPMRAEPSAPSSESVRAENAGSGGGVDHKQVDPFQQAGQALPGAQRPQSGVQPAEPENPYSN